MSTTVTAPPEKPDKTDCEFIPFGETEKIKLNVALIRRNFCRPTKSGAMPSDLDVLSFLMKCRCQKLNPYLEDAWLTGYDGQGGAQFSVLTSQRVLLKRAEVHEQFDAIESGITILEDTRRVDLPTEILLEGENLIGAWCRVTRKDRSKPIYKQIGIGGMKKDSPFWRNNPAAMIVKCAESDALRFAFPTINGGLYTAEEQVIDVGPPANSNKVVTAEVVTGNGNGNKEGESSVAKLAKLVTERGLTTDQFFGWAKSENRIDGDVISFDKLSEPNASRLLRVESLFPKGGVE